MILRAKTSKVAAAIASWYYYSSHSSFPCKFVSLEKSKAIWLLLKQVHAEYDAANTGVNKGRERDTVPQQPMF